MRLAKVELTKLVFMGSRVLIGFCRVGLIVGGDFVRILSVKRASAIRLWSYPREHGCVTGQRASM